MRKVLACLLVLMMILSLTPTAFADISRVTVDQDTKTVTQGETAIFIVSVTNDNRGMARQTSFSVIENPTLADVSTFDPATIDLSRNETAQTNLFINTSSLSTGTYTFRVEAKAPDISGRGSNGQNASSMVSSQITLTVEAAGGVDPEQVAATGVAIDQADQTITEGGTFQLTATVSPDNATNKSVIWSSDNTAVATVDSTGLVTGVAAGAADITVTTADGGFADTVTITVEEAISVIPVSGVVIDQEDQIITEDSTVHLTATISPENATNQNVSWSSSDEAVASVDANGLVAGLSAGTAIITVTTEDGGFTDTVTITVEATVIPVASVEINEGDQTITVGNTVSLSATVSPENATNQNVSWSSSDDAVASVDANGSVAGLAAGTATITVTTEDGGFTNAINITVEALPPSTSLSYVALGDSLVTGTTGVSGTMTSYVHGFRSFLQTHYGKDVFLNNLAADGDASGHLLTKLGQPDFSATVAAADVITLAIGGNNVMPAARDSAFWSINHTMAEAGTAAFEAEYSQIIARIRELNEDAELIVMTLYNPYNSANQPRGYSGDTQLHQEAAFYVNRINHQILLHASAGDYAVADVHSSFLTYAAQGRMGNLTFFYPSYSLLTWWLVRYTRDPHPNQTGQNLMRDIHQAVFTTEISVIQTEYPLAA